MPKRGRSFSNYARVPSISAMARALASRRLAKKRKVAPRKRKNFSLNTHHFSRYGEAGTLSYNGTSQSADFEFKFNQIINSSEFSTMFDSFKMDYVVVKFQMITNPDSIVDVNNTDSTSNQRNNWFPKLWYIRDYDSGSSETLSTIKERQGVKFFVMRPNKEYSVKLRPAVAVQTYRTATTTGYAPKRLFLDFANGLDVPHYGLKTVWDNLGVDPVSSVGFQLRWEVKYYFTCKDVR